MLHDPRNLLPDVDDRLVKLCEIVGATEDIIVVYGARTVEAEREAIASGHSALTNPLDSKHVIDPIIRPKALAVDVARFPIDWNDIAGFKALGANMKLAAANMGAPIVWGGDWSHLHDYDHFELIIGH